MPNAPDLPTLYHSPDSLFSQFCRLVLAEKNVAYRSIVLPLGPPGYKNFQPDYVRLNSGATVPTLVLDDLVLTDIEQYIYKIDKIFAGPKIAGDNRITTGNWVVRALALPHIDIKFSTRLQRYAGQFQNAKCIRELQKLARTHPDLTDNYHAKIEDIKAHTETLKKPHQSKLAQQRFSSAMDTLTGMLEKTPHLTEKNYTVADTIWTVIVARQQLLKRNPFQQRPALEDWFTRMKSRPSYHTANIIDHARIHPTLKMFWTLWR
ncbi:MAG: glutathione S-transferase family protein [Rhodobacteraceae bacterium]|nr:glutathione S-transferase family protein [Paracoccaceae bacterium]